MYNQLKAEVYKLIHTKAFWIMLLLVCCLFGLFFVGGEQQFVVAGKENNVTIGNAVGFLARVYENPQKPIIEEIIRTATSYTAFFWLIILVFTVSFFSKEYNDSTIKIAVAGGTNRLVFYISKLLIISIVSVLCYSLFTTFAFLFECFKLNYTITNADFLCFVKVLSLNNLVMLIFISIIILLCVIFKHSAIVVGVISFYIFSGALIYMMTWQSMNTQSIPLLAYLKTNPIYYWMNSCAYYLTNNFDLQVFMYFIFGLLGTTVLSSVILSKQEIK